MWKVQGWSCPPREFVAQHNIVPAHYHYDDDHYAHYYHCYDGNNDRDYHYDEDDHYYHYDDGNHDYHHDYYDHFDHYDDDNYDHNIHDDNDAMQL